MKFQNLLILLYTAPAPNSVEISSSIIFVGSQFNITCSVNLPPTVDIPVNVTVRISWKRSNNTLLIHPRPVMMKTLTQYTSTAVFVSDTKSDIEEYKCTAFINPLPPHVTSGKNKTGTRTFRIGKAHNLSHINFGVIIILITY